MKKNTKIKNNDLCCTQLFGLNDYFNDFVELYNNRKLPKVILLTGEKGIGKFTLSFHLINYFLTLNTNNPYNKTYNTINENNQVYKNILANICDNYHYISNYHNSISVEDVRNLKKKFSKTSINTLPRFTVIDDVEKLNKNSANALLKLIEEPSDFDFFILIYNKSQLLIETIKSRSLETKIFLSKQKKNEIFNNLKNFFNVNDNFVIKYKSYIGPGTLIKFINYIETLDNFEEKNFYDFSLILLDQFKKTKDKTYVEFIKLLVEVNFYNILKKNSSEILKITEVKNNIMKLLYQYQNFNLSNNAVLEYFKMYSSYVR